MDDFMNHWETYTGTNLGDLTGYNLIGISVMAVPERYLNVIDDEYYFPNNFQSGVSANKTNGKPNAIDMVYSTEGLTPYNSPNSDYYNITTTTNAMSLAGTPNYTQEIPILLPKGIEPILSQSVGDTITLCMKDYGNACAYKYRTIIRSYLTKLPGFVMTGFKQLAHLNLIGVVSYPVYQQMMMDFNTTYGALPPQQNMSEWGYTYDIPKAKLLIKYASNITEDRRQYIINGIRSTFPTGLSQPIMVDVYALIQSLKTINIVFTFIVGIIGVISLILTFFLLLVATTQNIKDNIWEYGVLRSMGITME